MKNINIIVDTFPISNFLQGSGDTTLNDTKFSKHVQVNP